MCKLLYSAKNTDGKYLEDIIDNISEELNHKLTVETHLPDAVQRNYTETNHQVLALLNEIKELTTSAIKYANKHTNLKEYILSEVIVLAAKMSYSDYHKTRDVNIDYGDDFEEIGYYIVLNKGKINHSEWWLPNKLFLRYAEKNK